MVLLHLKVVLTRQWKLSAAHSRKRRRKQPCRRTMVGSLAAEADRSGLLL